MNPKHLILGAALAALVSPALVGTAQAAPLARADAKAAAGPAIEKVQYRRCWYEAGYRVCDSNGGPRVYGWYYDEPRYGWRSTPTRPEDFRTGSRRWWSEMDREDRGGAAGR